MRKVEFAWLLPVCVVLIICAIGAVLLAAVNRLQEPAPAELAAASGLSADSTLAAQLAPADTVPVDSKAVAAGDALFKSNCAQCHAANDVVVGPALAGISERRPLSWIIPWVKNFGKMVARGDEYAVKIFNQYQKQQMPSFQLSEAEIKDIGAYIETQRAMARAPRSQYAALLP
ncbi:cytochrome c [Hymenobacter algoricola]|uniref:Cytochrome c domain-containing protein n=1 Tax=Hymenobacter algoricola TaxID=486267 RepID=A0ABP7MV63_9BACT